MMEIEPVISDNNYLPGVRGQYTYNNNLVILLNSCSPTGKK
jgi:hypothetical protein